MKSASHASSRGTAFNGHPLASATTHRTSRRWSRYPSSTPRHLFVAGSRNAGPASSASSVSFFDARAMSRMASSVRPLSISTSSSSSPSVPANACGGAESKRHARSSLGSVNCSSRCDSACACAMRSGWPSSFAANAATVRAGRGSVTGVTGPPADASETRRRLPVVSTEGVAFVRVASCSSASSSSSRRSLITPEAPRIRSSVLEVSTRLSRYVASDVQSTASSSGAPLKMSSSPSRARCSRSSGSSSNSISFASKSAAYTRLAASPSPKPRSRPNQSSAPIAREVARTVVATALARRTVRAGGRRSEYFKIVPTSVGLTRSVCQL